MRRLSWVFAAVLLAAGCDPEIVITPHELVLRLPPEPEAGMTPPLVRKRRCAVYTRKSTEDGLDQEFNSLDAQREACESYIASQKSEGWLLVGDRYDDGGYSGGNLDRPALKRLMATIEAGKIDVVVVYKIDRLSRSLMDFAKLVELFDRRGVIRHDGHAHRRHARRERRRARRHQRRERGDPAPRQGPPVPPEPASHPLFLLVPVVLPHARRIVHAVPVCRRSRRSG